MTKPTGRPRGRPKTKEYVTLMARVPEDLALRVQRYAALRQQPISVVLRDGLEMLLEEDRYRPFLSHTNQGKGVVSDRKEEPERPAEHAGDIVSDKKEERPTPARRKGPAEIVSDTKEETDRPHTSAPLSSMMSDTKAAEHDHPPGPQTPAIVSDTIPPFDTTRYTLGELCIHRHDYQGTGQSVRRLSDRECLECHNVRMRNYRQRKRTGHAPSHAT